jgi:hypothetical protein
MATITNPNLELKPDQSTKTVLATVTGKLKFTPYEMSQMQQGLRFRLKCELWGADSGFPDNGDDKLYSYSEIKTYPDSTPISSEPIKFEKLSGQVLSTKIILVCLGWVALEMRCMGS